jgi:SAM-dependent methyltransferase
MLHDSSREWSARWGVAEFHWHWVADVDSSWREAMERSFDPAAVTPVVGLRPRHVAGRTRGLLRPPPPVPFDVLVKGFVHGCFRDRLRHRWGGSGAATEFDSAIRLHEMGLPVPRPLALVDETGFWGCRASYHLMEHLAGAKMLGDYLAAAGPPGSPAFDALAGALARLLVDLASRRIWHHDVSDTNVLVTLEGQARLERVHLIDTRHVEFNVASSLRALEGMLTTLAGFLLAGGAAERAVLALLSPVPDVAAQAGGSMRLAKPQVILLLARRLAEHLVAREVRKGRRPAEDLDIFTRRYASASDAEKYRDRRFARSQHGRKVDAAERRIVEQTLMGLRINGPILDAPCGTGRFLPTFAVFSREIVGVDVSAEMLRLARQAAAEAGWPVRCLQADVRRLPFDAGHFELVFAMRLMHRIRGREERLTVLRELARVSRQRVLFSFYNRRSWRSWRDILRGRYPGETVETIRGEAAEAGLRVAAVYPVGRWARQTLVLCSVGQGPAQGTGGKV